ncbi:hypothetical protein BKA83DRAFT_4248313, partial [Pisolithus microcarpus]
MISYPTTSPLLIPLLPLLDMCAASVSDGSGSDSRSYCGEISFYTSAPHRHWERSRTSRQLCRSRRDHSTFRSLIQVYNDYKLHTK